MRIHDWPALALILVSLLVVPVAHGHDPAKEQEVLDPVDPIGDVLHRIKPTLDVRARYEFGKQTNVEESNATTLRFRLGVETPVWRGFKAFAEMEHTEAADRDGYRAASVHGPQPPMGKTIIADPESTELNRIWLAYSHGDSNLKFGRQRIKLDNDRFVGNVGWRQNEQTYDAVRLTNKTIPGLTLDYTYMWNVFRIFGSESPSALGQEDFDSRSHLANASYALTPDVKLTGYAYFLDLRNGAATGVNASNDTFGVSLSGKLAASDDLTFGYYGEYAYQRDAAGSLQNYRADYYHAVLSATVGKITGGLGYEVLGSGDGVGFQTPLATLHKFNGFADVFLATPMEGLIDRYAFGSLGMPWGMTFKAYYHDFLQEDSRGDFGHEYDLVLSKTFPYKINAMLKYARYTSERPNASGETRPLGSDFTRFVFQLSYLY